ncbi:Transcriptional activator protein ExaE [Dissostichus eleginoides]|uniref:Transcriptional activator protein ExaE n=1 Tax=Dissostichus eleginoides TaxID=100907 RepID=A0AAD9B3P3_DISEL|nr:Transcriptional activator protein ExaE [Dissostichus eleginoides]
MKARRSKREVSHLQRLLEREYAKGNCGATINQNVCDSLKARLRHVAEGKARAFLARSRAAFIEQSETCSAAFFSSVRAKKARQVVTGIRDSQGIVVTEDGQMVRVATDHFRDSFKEKEVGRGDDFLELLERQVPGDIVQALELPLTEGHFRRTRRKERWPGGPMTDGRFQESG